MITTIRTNSDHPDFNVLIRSLDAYLAITDGDEHAFYAQFNQVDSIRCVVLAYEDLIAVGCGAIKPFGTDAMEVKRMYVSDAHRNQGIASMILGELENWAAEQSCRKCVLETGKRQLDAVAFYKRKGYEIIPNYGQYAGVENSICFEKKFD